MKAASNGCTRANPYVVGLVAGVVLAPAVALWHGGGATGDTRDGQARVTRIDGPAMICERMLRNPRPENGDGGDSTGYRWYDPRDEPAMRFAALPGEAESAVRRACAERLAVSAA